MINHKKKFIFIHIPKTAGHSIDTMFLDLGLVDEGLWHYTSLEMIKKFNRKMWDEYFSFSIVRNPWSRFLSEYIWQGGNFKTAIETKWGNKDISFEDFCKSDFSWYPEYEKSCLCKTQYSYLVDNKRNICVKKIIKFENLQEEFLDVFNKIDIPKIKIPHRNKTEHRPYWEYYNDETKEIVAERFKEDIEFFGYKFGK